MVKNTCRDQGTALINVDPRSKQANLPKLLATRLAQTRVLKYNVENNKLTINIKNISARSKTGNISILLIKKIILLIAWALPSKEISITEKPVNQFAFQTTWQASKQCEQPLKGYMLPISKPCEQPLKRYMLPIKLLCKWNCNNILVIVKIIYQLKEKAWRSILIMLQWAALIDL